MKTLRLAILVMTLGAPAWAGNPLFEGWYADPEGTIIGDEYWIFPTYSAPYDQQLHFDAFSSKDLVTWTKHQRIISNREISWLRRALWAPAIVQKDGKFYLFFGANDVHAGEIGGIGVAVADRPDGPYKDLLGKPLIGEIHNGAQPIDQFVFQDKDGQYYMIYGGWSHCNIARLKADFTGFIPFDDGTTFKEITPQGYVEGPFMFLRDGKYYFMWSEGGWSGPRYSVAYAIADSPMGPFQRIGKVLQQDPAVATGAGHHSVIHDTQADIWYAVYHRRPLGETEANHRVTCMDRMYFDEQGFIKPIKITHEGVEKKTLAPGNLVTHSYVRPYKPSLENELLLNRIERLEQRNHLRVIDFVYFLAPDNDLVVKIDVKREGEPDKLKSMVMRVSSCRQHFSEAGMGVFSVTEEQMPDGRFFWYFDCDSGAGYGLFCTESTLKGDGPNGYEAPDQSGERLILRRASESGSIDIQVSAQICRTQARLMNPTIDPLYEDESRAQKAQ